jgi:hypothetical protein
VLVAFSGHLIGAAQERTPHATVDAVIESDFCGIKQEPATNVGHEIAPQQKKYVAPQDYSQEGHIEGLPLGTRGGMLIRHYFPADGEYLISWFPVRGNTPQMNGLVFQVVHRSMAARCPSGENVACAGSIP